MGLSLFALDALGMAGQTLIGLAVGAGDEKQTRALTRRMTWWSLGAGVVLGALTMVLRFPIAAVLTSDQEVQSAAGGALLVVGAALVITAYVCLFDGVLIGAGDGRYLAIAGVVTLACYAPMALFVAAQAPAGAAGLVWLWLAFAVGFMGVRAISLWWRQRGTAWLQTPGGQAH